MAGISEVLVRVDVRFNVALPLSYFSMVEKVGLEPTTHGVLRLVGTFCVSTISPLIRH